MDIFREWLFTLNYWRVWWLSKIRDKEKNTLRRYDIKRGFLKYARINLNNMEIKKIYDCVLRDDVRPFPYDFVNKYNSMNIEVCFDDVCRMHYVDWHGKKMFLKRDLSKERAQEYVRSILMEQDEQSPHRYDYKETEIKDKVIVDVGAAEGFFALDNLDKAKKIIMFECDDSWYEALCKTFEPYHEKVEIIKKYVSDKDDDMNVRLDTFFTDREADFLKADIEGYELLMIHGGEKTFNALKGFLICAYHKQAAECDIKKALADKFTISTSPGYMFFPDDMEQVSPYIRRGVLHGERIE